MLGEPFVDVLRCFAAPVGEHVGVQPYTAWQQAFDPLLARGARNYWKSHNFSKLSDGAIDAIIEYAAKLPSPHCEIFVGSVGGQTARVAADAMAYSSRDANYVMNVHGRWESAAEDDRCIAWAREFFAKRGYVMQQRNSISLGDEWLANTTMHKQLAAKPEVYESP